MPQFRPTNPSGKPPCSAHPSLRDPRVRYFYLPNRPSKKTFSPVSVFKTKPSSPLSLWVKGLEFFFKRSFSARRQRSQQIERNRKPFDPLSTTCRRIYAPSLDPDLLHQSEQDENSYPEPLNVPVPQGQSPDITWQPLHSESLARKCAEPGKPQELQRPIRHESGHSEPDHYSTTQR